MQTVADIRNTSSTAASNSRIIWLQFKVSFPVVLPLLVYLTVVTPFRLCFANEPPLYTPEYWIDFTIEAVFLVDIIINFRTGYFIEGLGDENVSMLTIEYYPKSVAWNYLRGWFMLDIECDPFCDNRNTRGWRGSRPLVAKIT